MLAVGIPSCSHPEKRVSGQFVVPVALCESSNEVVFPDSWTYVFASAAKSLDYWA